MGCSVTWCTARCRRSCCASPCRSSSVASCAGSRSPCDRDSCTSPVPQSRPGSLLLPGAALALPIDRPVRVLLLVHGTFSSTVGAFAPMGLVPGAEGFLPTVLSAYDAVLGYDHRTLSVDPLTECRGAAGRAAAAPPRHRPDDRHHHPQPGRPRDPVIRGSRAAAVELAGSRRQRHLRGLDPRRHPPGRPGSLARPGRPLHQPRHRGCRGPRHRPRRGARRRRGRRRRTGHRGAREAPRVLCRGGRRRARPRRDDPRRSVRDGAQRRAARPARSGHELARGVVQLPRQPGRREPPAAGVPQGARRAARRAVSSTGSSRETTTSSSTPPRCPPSDRRPVATSRTLWPSAPTTRSTTPTTSASCASSRRSPAGSHWAWGPVGALRPQPRCPPRPSPLMGTEGPSGGAPSVRCRRATTSDSRRWRSRRRPATPRRHRRP